MKGARLFTVLGFAASLGGCLLLDWAELTSVPAVRGDGGVEDAAPRIDAAIGADGGDEGGALGAYATMVIGDGPSAYLRFEEPSGAATLRDEMNEHPGVSGARTMFGREGAVGRAIENADVTLQGEIFGGEHAVLSMEAFFRLESGQSGGAVFLGAGSDGLGFLLGDFGTGQGTTVFFERHCCNYYDKAVTAVPVGQFAHVVGTFDGRMLRVYVNGALREAYESPGSLSASSFIVHIDGYGGTRVDELAIYEKVLPEARVIAHCRAAGLCT